MTRVLRVEDSPADVRLTRQALSEIEEASELLAELPRVFPSIEAVSAG